MRDHKEESYVMQIVPAAKVSFGRDVQIRLAVRPTLELVQDSLSTERPVAVAEQRRRGWRRGQWGHEQLAKHGVIGVLTA